jgi:hypothetical protein
MKVIILRYILLHIDNIIGCKAIFCASRMNQIINLLEVTAS